MHGQRRQRIVELFDQCRMSFYSHASSSREDRLPHTRSDAVGMPGGKRREPSQRCTLAIVQSDARTHCPLRDAGTRNRFESLGHAMQLLHHICMGLRRSANGRLDNIDDGRIGTRELPVFFEVSQPITRSGNDDAVQIVVATIEHPLHQGEQERAVERRVVASSGTRRRAPAP